MLFNSFSFLFLFLPLALVAYYGVVRFGNRMGNLLLLAASVCFYAFAGWSFLLYLGVSVVASYALAVGVSRSSEKTRTLLFALSLTLSVGALAVAKYSGFFVENVNRLFHTDCRMLNLVAPLGISFFTFSQVSFVVGAFRGEIPKVGFLDYALYIFYFPKLLMGPITDPQDFCAQLQRIRGIDWEKLASGLQQLAVGLFKKAFFADSLARVVAYGFGSASDGLSSLDTIIVMLAYTFEIYFDFSGYSDMAIGISRMFGIDLPPNFDSPYKAVSIRDFWRRWHISLTRFLTRYVYFPLGGSRHGTARTLVNIMAVFAVSGIWHGANWTFVIWGVLHGLLMVRERLMADFDERLPRILRCATTFIAVNVLWLMFRSADLAQFRTMLRNLRSLTFSLDPMLPLAVVNPAPLWLLLALAFGVCVFLPNATRHALKPRWADVLMTVALLIAGVSAFENASSFVYFNF